MHRNKLVALKTGISALAMAFVLSGCVSIGTDKVMHVSATGFISLIATCLADENVAVVTGAAAGLGAGLAKETYDSRIGGSGFSGEDLLADGIGTGIGTAIGYGLCHNQSGQ